MSDVFDYIKSLNEDLLEQFRGKPNTEVLMKALARQLQDVYQFFVDLREKRTLAKSEGKQLNGIGDIVVLSRPEAGFLASKMNPDSVLDDDLYRKYLTYKVFLNTNTCTYPDVIKALKMFWDTSPLYYSEDLEHPATMFFSTPTLRPEDNAGALLQVPKVKAAGVTLKLLATTETPLEPVVLRGCAVLANIAVTQLPEMDWEHSLTQNLKIGYHVGSITQTKLPSII